MCLAVKKSVNTVKEELKNEISTVKRDPKRMKMYGTLTSGIGGNQVKTPTYDGQTSLLKNGLQLETE